MKMDLCDKVFREEYIPNINSSRMLAEKYSVNPSHILNIVKNRSWKCAL